MQRLGTLRLIDPKQGAVLPYEIFLMVVEAVIDNAVSQSSMKPRILKTAYIHEDFPDDFPDNDHGTHLIVKWPTDLFNRFHLIRDIRQVNRQARCLVENTFFQIPAALHGKRIYGCLPVVMIWTCPQADAFAYPSINEFPEDDRIFGRIENVTMKAISLDAQEIANCVLALPNLRSIYLTPSETWAQRLDNEPHNHAEDLPLDMISWPDLEHVATVLGTATSQVLWDRNIRVIFATHDGERLDRAFELVRTIDANPQADEGDWGIRMRFFDLECYCYYYSTDEEIVNNAGWDRLPIVWHDGDSDDSSGGGI
ncbi:hypothetical protein CkaCkLH20_08940 [Colletotrichum karsti]|uniref:Uncharacterized protein n=1 Tax=Colletotrichum karsti TaxID=1095194 RepID=A0A9P6LHS4_9PEZI|nr:uncharacterized protein CkaCkLH20_08940 [Colletotrichum karsti]KAF9873481.1 hypothetical protein CkaCkLH20_08940 [Colletotrichum karsti]